MKSDIEIAQQAKMEPIASIADRLGLSESAIEQYGRYKAKVSLDVLESQGRSGTGKLILVTAISPTPVGEGKTTTTVGLGQALTKLGKKAVIALREPSLGPSFGVKGGAAGGGYSQVLPMEDINLHFTGDFHAITSAHNLLAALIDNHLQQGNELQLDPRKIVWNRVVDLNDRALRNVVVGLGGTTNGVPREGHFDITVASEVMAVLCLANGIEDLKQRLAKMVIGYTNSHQEITVKDLGAAGAMTVLLKDAIKPNLVQTIEGTPAFIHGGPFANIAHGCNSILATKMGLQLADYVVTEAGFGADLGAEKFFDIKSRVAGLQPEVAVIVATIRALKMHGGMPKESLHSEDVASVQRGLDNLAKHVENVRLFGVPCVVALNRFPADTEAEIAEVAAWCVDHNVPMAISEVFSKGGDGGIELAEKVLNVLEQGIGQFHPLYDVEASIPEKVETIAKKVYGADGVNWTEGAKKQIKNLAERGYGNLPICIAKTPYSFSDDPSRRGRPTGFSITVRDLKVSAGAGFIVVYTGDVMTMPGLPKRPAALLMDIDRNGQITGMF